MHPAHAAPAACRIAEAGLPAETASRRGSDVYYHLQDDISVGMGSLYHILAPRIAAKQAKEDREERERLLLEEMAERERLLREAKAERERLLKEG